MKQYKESVKSSFDIFLNDVSAELKKVDSYKQIQYHAKKAIKEQGAKLLVFEFKEETKEIYAEIESLRKKRYKGYYFFSNDKTKIYEL